MRTRLPLKDPPKDSLSEMFQKAERLVPLERPLPSFSNQKFSSLIKRLTEHYREAIESKNSQIKQLHQEMLKLKKESWQLNSELGQIKDECKQGILGIPEVQQALCEYNQREILFIFVLDDMTRDLSDRLGEVEYSLRKKYTDWLIGFEYVEDHISSEQLEESQVEIFDRD